MVKTGIKYLWKNLLLMKQINIDKCMILIALGKSDDYIESMG